MHDVEKQLQLQNMLKMREMKKNGIAEEDIQKDIDFVYKRRRRK